MILLKPESLTIIFAHAWQYYPEECCGFVYANGLAHCGTNIQNTLHAHNPETYGRDARIGYTFSVADLLEQAKPNKEIALALYQQPAELRVHASRHPWLVQRSTGKYKAIM
nr:hypothetical protein [Pollutimonas bauzanensis]